MQQWPDRASDSYVKYSKHRSRWPLIVEPWIDYVGILCGTLRFNWLEFEQFQ